MMNTPKPLNVFECPLTGVINVEASAGTGKTWNICGLYLRFVVEQQRKPAEILVVTFTEAATAELRDRIRTRLAEVWRALQYNQMPDGDPFVRDFIANCIDSGSAGMDRDKARNLIEAALLAFDEASIFTIHGFCHRALSESAFSAGQPFQSEVVSSGDEFIEQVAQDFWRREIIPRGGVEILELLDYFPSETKAARDKRRKKETTKPVEPLGLGSVLKEVVSRPLAELNWPAPPAPVDTQNLHAALEAARSALHAEIAPALDKLKESISAGIMKGAYLSVQSIDDAAAIWKTSLDREEIDFRQMPGAELLTTSGIRLGTRAKKTAPADPLFDTLDVCHQLLKQQFLGIEHLRIKLLRQFVEESPGILDKAKKRSRVITFDDMLHNLYNALCGSMSVGNLANILRQRFPCALIDEFQDTDPLQLAIFTRIYASTGPLFLVGDPKQAIYSFRGADLHTYLKARNAAQECFTLANNQRSTKAMIGAVNTLFGAHDRPFRIEDLGFLSVEEGTKPIPELVDKSAIQRPALAVWQLQGGTKEKPLLMASDARQKVIKATVAEIVRLLAAGQQGKIRIGQHGLQPRDIALLVRTHSQGRELKVALAAAGVNAVELSQSDVFKSFEAEEMERVLLAVADPANNRYLRGALATVLVGQNSTEIEAINDNEQSIGDWTAKFLGYRATWQAHGFGRMWREILSKEKVIERLLPLSGGERRATNLSHLAELLAAQYRRQPGIESLLKWLAERRSSSEEADIQQLRLESDENLVQIVTKHRSKGLEYPIVFCPFVWNDGKSFSDEFFDRYHDPATGKTVLDFERKDSSKQARKREAAEERLRVLYVALTRSIYRCYIAGGTYQARSGKGISSKPSARSALNWLVAGSGDTDTWDEGETSFAHIEECWSKLIEKSAGSIGYAEWPSDEENPYLGSEAPARQFAAKALSKKIPPLAWRMDSYSGLLRQQAGEYVAIDHDTLSPAPTFAANPPTSAPENDILRFSRGTKAGECVHSLFEKADFTRPEKWPGVIEGVLRRHFGSADKAEDAPFRTRQKEQLGSMLGDVLNTPLPGGWMLKNVAPQRRFAELKFFYSVAHLKSAALFDLLTRHGWTGKRINFVTLEGFMNGSIDFICEHEGRWYLIDWKSNYLGGQPDDYAPERVSEVMREESYDLQALIYMVALHRYLRLRLGNGYDAQKHLGGALYLFVRGVRPSWPGAGIWHWQPSPELIEELDAIFSSDHIRSPA